MSDLRKAAQLMLESVEQMLSGGEWYCARERADALRAALQDDPFKDAPWTPDDTAHRPGGMQQQEPRGEE